MFGVDDAGGAAEGTADSGAEALGGLAACASGLSAAVDGLLDLDPDVLGDGELAEAMVGLRRQQARLSAGFAELTAAFEARQVHAEDGARSATDWIAVRCRIPRPPSACPRQAHRPNR